MRDDYRAFVFVPSHPQAPSRNGMLDGMTLTVKDNIDVAAMPTRAASPALPDHPAERDAPVVTALRAAGAEIAGKSNMHELAFGVTSENPWSGNVVNPAFPSRIAGGSSGGTAAAIAGGLVHGGLGSDTGGSARIPAAMCGIVGFRPSTGRYPNRGVLLLSETFDTVGPMATTTADVERIDAALTDRPRLQPASLSGVRLAVSRSFSCDALAPEVEAAFEEACARLRSAGCTLVERDVAGLTPDIAAWHLTIVLYEAERLWRVHAERLGRSLGEFSSEIATPAVRDVFERLASGDGPSEPDYRTALERKRPAVRQALADYLAETRATALLAPASPIVAPPAGSRPSADDESLFDLLTRNMLPATIAAQPSICLPIGRDEPLGLLLDGRPGCDEQLLALALSAEPLLREG